MKLKVFCFNLMIVFENSVVQCSHLEWEAEISGERF